MFIFVVKPLGTCRGWGSSRSVTLLSTPPQAQGQFRNGLGEAYRGLQCAARLEVFGGAFFLLDGVRRRRGRRAVGEDQVRRTAAGLRTRVGPFSRITSTTVPCWGNPPFARGGNLRQCA
ncbi:unnamed protein product [Pleuronectes platessa]|uniref:Uncharacterized protein n=1 Tax=Pleuronectes platessa TaxID=8262 RepID=A0A9N7UZI3_PLEPL|nr:unnamed protein product [Pleuronectes platessa]